MPDAPQFPDPEVIRRTAAEVVQRPAYQIEAPPESATTYIDLLLKLLEWILTPLRWLFDAMEGMPDFLRYPIIVVLVIVLLAVIVHILYGLSRLFAGLRQRELPPLELQKALRDPAFFERQSQEAAQRQEYILAVRLLFSAGLIHLEEAQNRRFRAGMTNREVLRRHRDTPVFEPLELFVGTIESKWFGFETCDVSDYEACRAAYSRIVGTAKEGAHADRA